MLLVAATSALKRLTEFDGQTTALCCFASCPNNKVLVARCAENDQRFQMVNLLEVCSWLMRAGAALRALGVIEFCLDYDAKFDICCKPCSGGYGETACSLRVRVPLPAGASV